MSTQIDKNVPPPPIGSRSEHGVTVKQMEIGDSVFVISKREMIAYRSTLQYYGFKPAVRREGKGWRIWKRSLAKS